MHAEQSLDIQRSEFASRKFMAVPIAGAIAWLAIGICGVSLPGVFAKSMSIFVGTGSILYLAIIVARFTGEDFLGRDRPKNIFDHFFLLNVAQAVAVYAIAIPFFMIERESLPMTVGILTGLMWIPFSGYIEHWVGFFHAGARTLLVLVLWYALPEWRFVSIPFAIVGVYVVTIFVLFQRHQRMRKVG